MIDETVKGAGKRRKLAGEGDMLLAFVRNVAFDARCELLEDCAVGGKLLLYCFGPVLTGQLQLSKGLGDQRGGAVSRVFSRFTLSQSCSPLLDVCAAEA
jgi:hypothetical protein